MNTGYKIGLLGLSCLGLGIGLGSFIQKRWDFNDSRELPELVHQLRTDGYYDLPCGGGPLFTPERAVYWGKLIYGKRRYCYLNFRLLFDPVLNSNTPPEALKVSYSVVYRLADEHLLNDLLLLQQEWSLVGFSPKSDPTGKMSLEFLIVAICHRLERPLPVGFAVPNDTEVRNMLASL